MATLLTLRLRNQDIVGRYGGEEFAIALPRTNAQQSRKIIDELREQFSQCYFTNTDNFFVTFSAGIAQINNESNTKEMIDQADQALYEAKYLGRNQIVFFEDIK